MPSRVVVLTVALLAAGLTVSACSGGSNQSGGSAAVNGAALPSEGHTAATAGVRAQSVPGALAISALTDRDLVLRATLSVRVSDVSAAAKRAEQLVATARGFVASENVHTDPGTPAEDTATMSLRVPESSYDAILASLVRLGTRVSEQQSSDDVTDQVVDTSSRLSTAKTGIARVRALLDRADNLGQVIQLESELSKREADLESLEQRLANLHRQVALATVDVTFSKSAKVLGAHKHHRSGFVGGITGGWHAFGTALAALLTAIGALLPFALALLAIAAVGTFVRRRLWPAATIGDDSRAQALLSLRRLGRDATVKKDAKIERLSQVPMFSACSRKDLGLIARYADELSVDAGATVVREGDAGREFYVLVEGKASVTRGDREIAVLGPGSYFGELALLDGQKRDATVTTATPADLLVVGMREFATLLEDVPQITRKLLAGMARRLHELDSAG